MRDTVVIAVDQQRDLKEFQPAIIQPPVALRRIQKIIVKIYHGITVNSVSIVLIQRMISNARDVEWMLPGRRVK